MKNRYMAAQPSDAIEIDGKWVSQDGLSKIDYAAIKAMQGLCANQNLVNEDYVGETDWLYKQAIQIADGQLQALEPD